MQGLKTPENERFKRFFALVQAEATKRGKIFFVDAGDGTNLFEDSELDCEDLMGWLINQDDVAEFERDWEKDSVPAKWDDEFIFAVWSKEDNGINIDFKAFE